MSWVALDTDLQTAVLTKLRLLAVAEKDDKLSHALAEAANELELWLVHETDPFTEWLELHENELKPYVGQTVAIHLEKGVIASSAAETFWDGTFRDSMNSLFQNDPSIFITVVPDKSVEAVEQK